MPMIPAYPISVKNIPDILLRIHNQHIEMTANIYCYVTLIHDYYQL
jgi:hypothetical protein